MSLPITGWGPRLLRQKVPYIAVFVTFVAYPVVYGLWTGSDPSLYRELFADPIYQSSVVNTVLYLALGVNVKMFLALPLSGFFMRPGWWMKALLLIFVLQAQKVGSMRIVFWRTASSPTGCCERLGHQRHDSSLAATW